MDSIKIVVQFFAVCSCCSLCSATLEHYERRCVDAPNDVEALYNLGVAAFKEDALEKAKQAFDCAKKSTYDNELSADRGEQLYYNAGNTEMKLQAYADAVESFSKVLEYNPSNELARKKRDLAQQLLEQQKQQQEQQNNKENDKDKDEEKNNDKNNESSDNQNSGQNDADNDDSSDDKQDQNSEQNSDQNDADNKSSSSDENRDSGDQKNQDRRDAQDDQRDDEQSGDSQQGDGQDSQDAEQEQEKKSSAGNEGQDEKEGNRAERQVPDLTDHEKNLMRAIQALDEKMNKDDMQKKIRGIACVGTQNNW